MNTSTLVIALATTIGGIGVAHASATNPFSMQSLSNGYMLAAAGKSSEGKCGEGKCGGAPKAAPSKGKKNATTDTSNTNKESVKAKDGKCGEGKCGGSK